MKKFVTRTGQVWIKFNEETNQASIGLTQDRCADLGEFIAFVPRVAMARKCTEGQHLAVMETNRCLTTLRCPLKGTVIGKASTLEERPNEVNAEQSLFIFDNVELTLDDLREVAL